MTTKAIIKAHKLALKRMMENTASMSEARRINLFKQVVELDRALHEAGVLFINQSYISVMDGKELT